MKKTFLFLTLSTLVIASTFARDISEKRDLAGFTGGLTLNTMGLQKNSTYSNSKNSVKPGGIVGVNYEHRCKKVFAIEIALNYINKGTQQLIQDPALNRSYYRLNFHSLEIPIIGKFYMGKKKIFNLNFGGYASYCVDLQSRTKIDFKNSAITDIDNKENNLLKDHNDKDINGQRPFRAYDAGINVGFEFVSKMGLGVGARVQQGFVDFTNPKFFIDDKKKVYHTSAMIYALFKI